MHCIHVLVVVHRVLLLGGDRSTLQTTRHFTLASTFYRPGVTHETLTSLYWTHLFVTDIVNYGSLALLAETTDLKDGAGEDWAGQFKLYEVRCSMEKYPRC